MTTICFTKKSGHFLSKIKRSKPISCLLLFFTLLFISNIATADNTPPDKNNSAAITQVPPATIGMAGDGSTTGGISANPGAVNISTGTAGLQKYFEKKWGITNNHGIRVGGVLLGDVNDLFSGGITQPQRWTSNGLLIFEVSLDAQKALGWKGAMFDVQFLQFNGQNTNDQAGTFPGYNSLPGNPPLNRSELYQLWYRQSLFNDKFIFRIGKSVPTFDFNNVSQPVPLGDARFIIPAVSGLIYTSIFVNPTMLGVMPGYYNSAYGITLTLAPTKKYYFSYGIYDGAAAQGKQTGTLSGPVLDGSYFNIGEAGLAWLLGDDQKPGNIGLGGWHETGPIIPSPGISENGASGAYIFGTQRLWYRHPHHDISGVSAFYQYGINNASTLGVKQFLGAGATAFALVPRRENDSFGMGVGLSWMNPALFLRATELMYQAYYQAQITKSIYLQPTLTLTPTPSASPTLNAAWAGTMRLIVLF